MKKGISFGIGTIVLFLCLVLQTSSAQSLVIKDTTTISSNYPRFILKPSVPVPGKVITLDLIIGTNPDGCVPTYTTTIKTAISKSYPPIIDVYLDYNEVPFNRVGIGCITVLTSYGPSFGIGTAEVGKYRIFVKDSLITEFKVESFSDTINPTIYPYSVLTPQVPQIGDNVSVRMLLGEDSVNCVKMFKGKIVSHIVQELYPPTHVVKVEYEEQDVSYKACLPIKTLYGPEFDLGKVEIGTYVVYNGEQLVTKFFVGDTTSTPSQLPLKFTPEQPVEGDTLRINQISGYGSSSCSPLYSTSFELVSEGDGQFTYKLSYSVTDRSKNEKCTADYRAYGPTWVIPGVRAGYYLFNFDNKNYLKVIVNKNQELPTFICATIKGVAGFGGLIDAMRYPYISQCTVAVVSYHLTGNTKNYTEGSATELSVASTPENMVECSVSKYMAITDKNGNFIIKDIPVSVLMGNAYLVAVKGALAGYAAIPSSLNEEMNINLFLQDYNVVVDSMKIAQSDEILELFRAVNTASVNDLKRGAKSFHPAIITLHGGIQFTIPVAQKISVSAFAMNGKLLWNKHQGILSAGIHRFDFPKESGIFIMRIKGETFSLSQSVKMTK